MCSATWPAGRADLVLIATGSEVMLASAGARCASPNKHVAARVVSMPSTTRLRPAGRGLSRLRRADRDGIRRVAVEAGVTAGWWKYVGLDGAVVGIDRFGESAPGEAVFAALGLTTDRIVETAQAVLKG